MPVWHVTLASKSSLNKMNTFFENIKVKRINYLNQHFPLPKREEFKFENVIDLDDFE